MLIVGLGNPGTDYADTRHNVGFMAVDEIVRCYSFTEPKKKFKGELYDGQINGTKVLLLKPQTFMNKSGISVAEVASFYKIPLEQVIVLYDELDIPVGKVKAKTGGGAGGHNGIKSIDSHLGKDYRRIRIGIDHPGNANKVNSYVLKPFKKQEQETIDHLLVHIAEEIPVMLTGSDADFTTALALRLNPPKHTPKPLEQQEESTDGI